MQAPISGEVLDAELRTEHELHRTPPEPLHRRAGLVDPLGTWRPEGAETAVFTCFQALEAVRPAVLVLKSL